MLSARYLVVGLVLTVLLVAVWGMGFVVGQITHATDESSAGTSTSGDNMGSMMNGGGTMGSHMVSSLDEEGKPFDLQFIDQMIPHHEGALMSSEHMISNSKRPEIRQLYEDIQKSQSQQIEQMQEWRKEWYSRRRASIRDDGQRADRQYDGQRDDGRLVDAGMMGGNALDTMFLKMMIPHHQMAVDMSDEALSKAEHPELRDLAQKIRDEQSSEIELMQGYLNAI
jgi:uncharacterized protein (DUF305 family)